MVDPSKLKAGENYFMVTYPEASMTTPIIITYRFLGKDPEGVEQDDQVSHYYFRCLPPFQPSEEDEEMRALAVGWEEVFPGAFSGWGEKFPSSFTEEKLAGFNTLDELYRGTEDYSGAAGLSQMSGPHNNELKLTRSAHFSVARPSQLNSVFDGRLVE